MPANAFAILCSMPSETLHFPKIHMFGLALDEVSFKVNVNETTLCLPTAVSSKKL